MDLLRANFSQKRLEAASVSVHLVEQARQVKGKSVTVTSQARFVAIDLAVVNQGQQALNILAWEWTLVDDLGRRHSMDGLNTGILSGNRYGGGSPLLQPLNPGMTGHLTVLFDTPEDAAPKRLEIRSLNPVRTLTIPLTVAD
jgi:hypothetical protein